MNKLFDIDTVKVQEVYRGFFYENSSIMMMIDPESRSIVDVNEAALEFYKYSKSDFVGKKLNEINIYHDEVINQGISDVLDKKKHHFLFKHRIADGDVRDVEVSSGKIVLAGKELICSSILDVTDKVKSSSELSRLHTAIVHSPGPVAMTDLNGIITFVNPAFCSLSGYSDKALIGSPTSIFNSGIQTKEFYTQLWDSILNGETWMGEFSNIDKAGNIYIEEARISPVYNAKNEMAHFIKVSRDVTKEREMEQELENSRNMLLQILDNMPGGYLMVDENFKIRQVNQSVCQISGYTQEELVGGNCSLICPSVRPNKQCPFCRDEAQPFLTQDTSMKCKDGSLVPILKNARIIEIDGEKLLIENFQNIGALKATEQELIAAKDTSENLKLEIETIIENTNESIWAIDREYRITYLNHHAKNTYQALFGGHLSLGLKFTDILSDEQKSVWIEKYDRGFEGESFTFVYDVVLQSVSYYMEVLVSPIFKRGVVEGISFYASDITQRIVENDILKEAKAKAELSNKKIENQNQLIQLHNQRLESLLRLSKFETNSIQELLDFALHEAIELTSSKIGYIYFYDEDTELFTLNTWSKEVMKACRVMDPKTIYELDKTGAWGEAVRQRKAVVLNDYTTNTVLKKGLPHGHVALTKFMTIPVFYNKRIVAVCGVANKASDYNDVDVRQLTLLMDNVWGITERINLIENLKTAKFHAEESDRLKTAFLANMSHEIRTPMNGILGFTNLLDTQSLTDEKRGLYIDYIKKSGERMLNTVNDIIEISRIEVGEIMIHNQEVTITDTLSDIYEFFRYEAANKGLTLTLELPEEIHSLTIHSDLSKLESVVTNFVKNAIKYSDYGEIVIGFQLVKDKFVFYCKDEGIGVPKNRQEAIFNRFEQADIEDIRALQGSGLGLAIAKAYIEMLNGNIWVDSEVGKGSTFLFMIPVDVVEHKVKESSTDTTLAIASDLRILLVDDDLISQEYLKIILEPHVSNLFFADNGQQAIEVYQNNDIDVILMDLKMPIMTGYEATRKIRQTDAEVFIIAQTAYALDGDEKEALDAGCDAYISKPVSEKSLVELLKTLVN